jgi:hypothetical protein
MTAKKAYTPINTPEAVNPEAEGLSTQTKLAVDILMSTMPKATKTRCINTLKEKQTNMIEAGEFEKAQFLIKLSKHLKS